jgi:hypothetical protein
MTHRMPRAPRVVPWMLAALSAAPLVPASGEEVLSAIPGRLDGEVDSRIVPRNGSPFDPQAGEVRGEELEIGVVLSAAYDDNIYLSATRKEADLVMRVAPAISYRRGDKLTGEGGYLSIAYRPTAVAYAENSNNNRLDQIAEWDVGWRGKKTAISWKGRAGQLGDATADTGTLTDRSEFSNEVRLAWAIREKVSLEVAGGYESVSYDSSAYADSHLTYAELALKYAYSPKTRLGMMYKAGSFEVDGAGGQTVHRVTGRIEWHPREKIAVDLEIGGEHRTFDNGSDTTPVVEGRIGWEPKEGTEVYLTGYRREQASAYLPGQNYTQTGTALGISQRLGGAWTARIEGGVEHADYSVVSGTGAGGREDRIHFLRPALEYRVTDDFSMGLFYRYSENDSNQAGLGHESHSAGVEMGYRF